MSKRKLYDGNKGLMISGFGFLVVAALVALCILRRWYLIVFILGAVALTLLFSFLRDLVKLIKVKRMTDEEYQKFLGHEREMLIADAFAMNTMHRTKKKLKK